MSLAAARDDEPGAFAGLLAAIHAELAALDSGDPGSIEDATAAKLAALERVRGEATAGFPPARADIEAARRLNDRSQARATRLAAGVARQLARLAGVPVAADALCYGPDGRL